jgi:hypothetical protein
MDAVRSAIMSAMVRAISSLVLRVPSRTACSIFARLCFPFSLRNTRAVGSWNPGTCDMPASANARPTATK